MKTANDSDVVAEITNTGSPEFHNWFNDQFKKEFIHDCHRIQMNEFTPGLLRADIMIAFEAGRRNALKELMEAE